MVLKFDGHCPGALQRFDGDTLAEGETFCAIQVLVTIPTWASHGPENTCLAKNPEGQV